MAKCGQGKDQGNSDMKKTFTTMFFVLISLVAIVPLPAADTVVSLPVYLQEVSLMVLSPSGSGSGVVVTTKSGTSWVWTAAHVVEPLRREREENGNKKIVTFGDAKVCKIIVQSGRTVAKLEADAEIVRYSDADRGQDLALLRIRMSGFPAASAKFYLDEAIPGVDTALYHCGSQHGEIGANTLTRGYVTALGRLITDHVFDQSSCPAKPGSSGGGIFLQADGRYIGMLVRGSGDTFNFYVPIRRMREFAKKSGVEFTLDPSLSEPSDADLRAKPIEDPALN